MIDITIIGGGIVGMATALGLQTAYPGLDILVIEKEDDAARHQTGRNSGVIHAGIYYSPGSLKADFCRRGLEATYRFCREHDLPVDQCGKLLVATTVAEMERMRALGERARKNGLELAAVDKAELREREPNVDGLGALFSPLTGIVDYSAMTKKMAALFREGGGTIRYNAEVRDLRETANDVEVALAEGDMVRTRHLVACGGLMADRLAAMCGIKRDFAIVPFKGEYFRLAERHNDLVRHLIYPIPDPALPFLGIHLTRMIGGYVTVGPNAVLSLAREGYGKARFNLRDVAQMAAFPGFWRTIGGNLKHGLAEMANSLSRRRYLRACQRYCPTLELSDLRPYRPGIRAQAVMTDGTLAHDFLIRETNRTIHICNAPSPAATSAMPIADHIRARAAQVFGL